MRNKLSCFFVTLLFLSLVEEEVDASLGPEYASTLQSLWCVYIWIEGWDLKVPVPVPSLHAQAPFHARLQKVSPLYGGRHL